MRKLKAIVVVLMAAAGVAPADEVTVEGLPYPGVQIVDAQGGQIAFRMPAGNVITKPLADVTVLKITDAGALNQAEELMQQDKGKEAVRAYDEAMQAASQDWLQRLIRHRRLRALDQAGLISRWTEEWLTIAEAEKASKDVLSLRPKHLPERGSKDNGEAIRLLEVRLRQAKQNDYARAIKELLFELYRQEGRESQAVALALELGKPIPTEAQPQQGQPAPEPGADARAQLEKAAFLLEQGKADEVLAQIQANLKAYPHADLAKALLIRGKARMRLAEKAAEDQKRKLLLEAGLDFMRVAVFFPSLEESPEALYQAGRVNAALGNSPAASAAYQQVIRRHPNSEFAKKARAELAAMESTGKPE